MQNFSLKIGFGHLIEVRKTTTSLVLYISIFYFNYLITDQTVLFLDVALVSDAFIRYD